MNGVYEIYPCMSNHNRMMLWEDERGQKFRMLIVVYNLEAFNFV